MERFIEGRDRRGWQLLPDSIDDYSRVSATLNDH